jgi:hypothetical protein
MREKYEFKVSRFHGAKEIVTVDIDNKREVPVVLDKDGNGILEQWIIDDYYDDPPIRGWKVDVGPPSKNLGPPDDDNTEVTLDMYAWQCLGANGGAKDVTMLEWADGSVEIALPEHDATGTMGRPIAPV